MGVSLSLRVNTNGSPLLKCPIYKLIIFYLFNIFRLPRGLPICLKLQC